MTTPSSTPAATAASTGDSAIIEVTTMAQLKNDAAAVSSTMPSNNNDKTTVATGVVLLFWAPWHDACATGGPVHQVLEALAASSTNTNNNNLLFGRVNVDDCDCENEQVAVGDEQEPLTLFCNVTAVPTFVLLSLQHPTADSSTTFSIVERIVVKGGDDIAAVTQAASRLASASTIQNSTATMSSKNEDTADRITAAAAPASSRSSTNTTAKNQHADNSWDVIDQRLDRLIRSAEVMVFMKGTPAAPQCGFSRQICAILDDNAIPYHSFDILQDDTVRQELKRYSNWPTYPQLYVKGELVGGLDILNEMISSEDEDLKSQLGISAISATDESSPQPLEERLKALIHRSPVMLFMKGLPSQPKCGFSRTICEILQTYNVAFDSFDILQGDDVIRQGLKKYSNWPTFPQLYVHGELLGGLDIVQEMHQDGTLQAALEN